MHFRYREYDPSADQRRRMIEQLKRLYGELLLRAAGDAEQALEWLRQVAERYGLFPEGMTIEDVKRLLEKERLVQRGADGSVSMSPGGERALRQESLERVFQGLGKDGAGDHRVASPGSGHERLPETRPFAFGDSVELIDPAASVRNALKRGLPSDLGGLSMQEEDLEVHETEHLSSCATVLLIDLSHSMILYGEDRITPAKRVALALVELIRTRYPKDSLKVVCFGDEAWEVGLDDIPRIQVGPFHTNTRAGLQLARDLLRRERRANRQIFMITDGKPSALTEPDGEIYKNPFGLDRRVVSKTIDEATICRRHDIPITTFMLTDDPTLVGFVEQFTEANKGRAYFAGGDELATTLFVDYMKNRRSRR
ncbi:MAG: VWA domain-containing protein [Planctomycetota bacterium]|nr:VWA domain-containing protein [Planctomycetota bacterium]